MRQVKENETILFLHGSGPGVTSIANWSYALNDCGNNFHCLAPDLYGFAEVIIRMNRLKNRQLWMDCWVEQLIELLDYYEIEKAM